MTPGRPVVNMHCHSFFSYNGYGYSPSYLAWLAKRDGYGLIGLVDFDVLDGADEFLDACDALGVRGTVGMETRVYVPEYASKELNSPGEPGVSYQMGIGFTSSSVPIVAQPMLEDLSQRSEQRNRGMVERLNRYLRPVEIDYDADVLPLTPGGNATERHMVVAYIRAAQETVSDPADFWTEKLGLPPAAVATLMADEPKLEGVVRSRLMKRGGVGYVQPGEGSFPSLADFHRFLESCGAIPCATWLDGTSDGEAAIEDLLNLMIERGAAAVNVVPDRNWNIPDPDAKRLKIKNLYRLVELAQELSLPLNVGTELNKHGQKLIDDFDAPELAPVREAFVDGAYFVYGHTVAERTLGIGYQSEWARAQLGRHEARAAFYTRFGHKLAADAQFLERLRQMGTIDPATTTAETVIEQ